MKITKRERLDSMPFDKTFCIGRNEELCNATGYEVQFEGDDKNWWNEYVDSNGSYHYGR